MKEKTLNIKKNGVSMLLLLVLLYAAGIGCIVAGCILEENGVPVIWGILVAVGVVWMVLGWIPFLGLTVLKPQEAVVLTLFGNYVGTLREPGFYYVNPFCTSVNPAARTRLSQSGEVDGGTGKALVIANGAGAVNAEVSFGKKISLKVMTLNNSRQKINDCLGNPVEIGIAVTWRVVDTAKAVFQVDNYKEYLSLQ